MIHVDLRRAIVAIVQEFAREVRGFESAWPEETSSAIGLVGDGYHGTISLALDTQANSAAYVDRYGPSDCGRDEAGAFCDNAADMSVWLADVAVPGFPGLHQLPEDAVIALTGLDGDADVFHPEDDERSCDDAIAAPLLDALASRWGEFAPSSRTPPFRVITQFAGMEARSTARVE